MTDSEFFELRIKAFLQFCWKRKYLFLVLLLATAAPIYFALATLQVAKYRTTIQFAKADYDLWSGNFYSLKAATIYLKNYAKAGGDGSGTQPPDNSNGGALSADVSDEDLESPDDFAAMLLTKVPTARIVSGVAEVQLVTKDPNFVERVFYPLVNISRQIMIDAGRDKLGRINPVYDELSRGSLSQKEKETVEENQLNFKISTIIREVEIASAIDTREKEKNVVVAASLLNRLRWALTLSLLISICVFLVSFAIKEFRASHGERATSQTP